MRTGDLEVEGATFFPGGVKMLEGPIRAARKAETKTEIDVRHIGPEWLPSLVPLAKRFHEASGVSEDLNSAHWITVWMQLLASGMGVIFVAFDGEKPVGMIGGLLAPSLYANQVEAIEAFWWVDPEARAHGTGADLLLKFEEFAKAAGAKKLIFSILESISSSAKALEGHGFTKAQQNYQKEL